jgi:hypothetical protein
MYGEKVYTGFWWGTSWEKEHLEDPDIDGRIILRWIFRKCDGSMEWVYLPLGTGGGLK